MFDGLSNVTTLAVSNNALAALEANVFDGLSSLTTLRLNNNASLAALPGEVFDGLSSLATLRLNNNALTALPDGVFDGLTGLEGLYVAGNPGSAFTLTAAVEQTVATEVTVAVAQAAPFDMSVTLAVQGGTLSDDLRRDPCRQPRKPGDHRDPQRRRAGHGQRHRRQLPRFRRSH